MNKTIDVTSLEKYSLEHIVFLYQQGYSIDTTQHHNLMSKSRTSSGFHLQSNFPTIKSAAIGNVAPIYRIKDTDTLIITPTCSGTLSVDNYSQYLSGGKWTYKPVIPNDSGTVKTLTFTCTEGSTTSSITTKIYTFRNFANFTHYANPVTTPDSTLSSFGTDTPYFTTDLNIGGTYHALTQGCMSPCTGPNDWTNILHYTSTDLFHWTLQGLAFTRSTNPSAPDYHWLVHPCVVKNGSTYYAFYGGKDNTGNNYVNLATSTDFVTWTKYSGNPIISGQTVPVVIKYNSTTWYMYTSPEYTDASNCCNYLWLYSSTDLIHWTFVRDHIAAPQTGDWDYTTANYGKYDPWIIKNSKGFYELVYTVRMPDKQHVGYALSDDGINFQEYYWGMINNADGDPVLVETTNGFKIYYEGNSQGDGNYDGHGYLDFYNYTGGTLSASITINGSACPATVPSASCPTVAAVVSGGTAPYTYTWTWNGTYWSPTTQSFTTCPADGTNTIGLTVTDSAGATGTASCSITIGGGGGGALNVSMTLGGNPCQGATIPSGSCAVIAAVVSGGTAPYSYSWVANGSSWAVTTSSANTCPQNGSNTYTVTVHDSTGATGTGTCTFNVGGGGCTTPKYKCSGTSCISDNCDGTGIYTTSTCNNACSIGCTPNWQCIQPLNGYEHDINNCPGSVDRLNSACNPGGGGITGCTNCDLTKNYCVAGNCIPKSYVLYGGIGFGAIFLLSLLK